ncbi:FAD/NAD(P)-binding protein [uncultured Aquimarina sp.]|uniref:FAD-dependent oxidoreductase n=1 Tax=uncultured Aquimarina sp. TaxID=575652 RepID=UPI00260CC3EE|nr:FAD/NAD(P)-binding protein [uncultured Aquimarina sp.]
MTILKFNEISDHDDVDIAIIGAGISGLYCAYRLINDPTYSGKKIAIYERLNRTGGRLQSDLIPIRGNHKASDENGIRNFYDQVQIDWVKEEQGGMRFNYNMEELMTLNGALNICDEIVPFPMSSTDDTNRFCIRGHSFSLAEANAGGNMIWSQLYDLSPEEIGLSPVQIVTNAYNRILEANDIILDEDQTPEYWQKFRLHFTWKGIPINEWQLWGLLRDMGYSEECIEMLTNTIGFAGPFKSLPNAGDAWQILADFPKDPTYYTFKYGFSTLPDTIKKELEGKVNIYLSTNIDSIQGEENDFTIHLTEAPEGQNSKPNIPCGEYKKIKAKQIISAIAATGFKSLYTKSPALYTTNKKHDGMRLWESINGVLGMNLMKINFYFREAWWYTKSTGRPKIEFGPNFTDLPINSIYPFYSVEDLDVDHKKGTVSLISGEEPAALTLYCDFNNTNFWKGLQNVGPKFTSPLQEKYNEMKSQTVFPASQAVVAEARKQMGLLFGVTNIPEPIFTSYRLWNGEDDFEHAYHQWQLNVDDKKTIEYLSNPLPGFYMCNEAISDMQGWVNGSLRSSDLALSKISKGVIKPMDNTPCKSLVETKDAAKTKTPLRVSRGHWG